MGYGLSKKKKKKLIVGNKQVRIITLLSEWKVTSRAESNIFEMSAIWYTKDV